MLTNESEIFSQKLQELPEWKIINFIFSKLDNLGRLCWISGGAVRDLLLDRGQIQDVDLTTDATEEEILYLFPQTVLVGRQFGVYKIPLNGLVIDLTVFRTEDEYLDGRRPLQIHRAQPEQDAKRRDFTINALFWDLKNQKVIDYVGGISDLKNKKINCVGDPEIRFREDHLRILRLIRFKAQLEFEISEQTYSKAIQLASLTQTVSGERLFSEITKIKNVKNRQIMYQDNLFLEIMKHNDLNISCHVEFNKNLTRQDLKLDLVVLFEIFLLVGISEENKSKILERFKLSRHQGSWLSKIIDLKQLISNSQDFSDYVLMIDESVDYFDLLKKFLEIKLIDQSLYEKIEAAIQRLKQKVLIVALDILNFVDKKDIGITLKAVRKQQILGHLNSREEALNWIKNKQT